MSASSLLKSALSSYWVAGIQGSTHFYGPPLIFPEGTTSNGQFLLHFHKGAFLPGLPLQPVLLRYPCHLNPHPRVASIARGPAGGRFNPAWESIEFLRHFWLMLCQEVNYVEVFELPIYYPSIQEEKDPELYAKGMKTYMLKYSGLRSSESGLKEKRIYHSLLRGAYKANKKTE